MFDLKRKTGDVHSPGIEPGSGPWQGPILPLDQECADGLDNVRISDIYDRHRHARAAWPIKTISDRQISTQFTSRNECTRRRSDAALGWHTVRTQSVCTLKARAWSHGGCVHGSKVIVRL